MEIIASTLSSWTDVLPDDWTQHSRTLEERGLHISHDFQPASELDLSAGFTEHYLSMVFNGNRRQIHRFAGQERDTPSRPGDILLLPAATPSFHAWECDRADEGIGFYINPQHLQQLAAENDILHPERLELRPILHTRDPQIEALATAFRTELCQPQLGSRLYSESLANQVLIHLLRHYCSQPLTLRPYEGGLSSYQLRHALDFIHAYLNRDLKLQEIADRLGMSQYYFCRLFKQSMGISPYHYVLQQRVELAKRLLTAQRTRAICDIALDCGFSSQSQMTEHFRRRTGTTPAAYRRQH